ncbi:tether containing UBX domain for GLUT4 isoform X2 [Hydra vulgaris]|uniref:Tether containing UBX domain for GLUT4 isoform X2 n=1 Tax=Hydra vulgaris TaxID=6087 RepID=A0ABM4CDM0_HYDVU
MSNKYVEVLCPNGRRVKVKTQPQMTALQILQDVCEKEKEYDENEYELKHQNKFVSLSSLVRFLNFTNNAKLEMVKSLNPRKGLDGAILIALQLEDGTRHHHSFSSNQSLLDVLKRTEQTSGLVLTKPEAVCIYMQHEYKGLSLLAETTLKSMGILQGRAIIRLLFRDDAVLESESVHVEPNSKKVKRYDSATGVSSGSSTVSATVLPAAPSTCSSEVSSLITNESYSDLETTNLILSKPPPYKIFPNEVESNSSVLSECTYVSHFSSTFIDKTKTDFSTFKFPDSSDKDLNVIDPDQIRDEVLMSMPCDREAIVFSMSNFNRENSSKESSSMEDETRGNLQAEPDENFFKLTIDDLRSRLTDLKAELAAKDEAMLMTKAMREKKEMEKISNIGKIPIRFQFPDKIVVQAFFRPLETVQVLKEFLDSYVSEDILKYEMFTTPPRIFLKDLNATLYQAKLFPSSIIHISTTSICHNYLKSIYLEKMHSWAEADDLVSSIKKRSNPESELDNHKEFKTLHSSNVSTLPRSSTSTLPKKESSQGKPKWFKTGK